jgi:hypothetical protein
MAQLVFQHNDAVDDEDDARDKYVARQLFRKLAADGRLAAGLGQNAEPDTTFRLWSEDLRPSNVLIDKELRVVGVIDWEFAYVAPSQFTFDPPWWLLLTEPDEWAGGYSKWTEAYEPRLDTFLRILEDEERHTGTVGKTLAQRMRESWESKTWMVNFIARRSWYFDALYWRVLDPAYFGPNEDGDYKVRLGLLKEANQASMEPLVRRKLEEAEECILVEWEEEAARSHLANILN